jgi:hypothetical protein
MCRSVSQLNHMAVWSEYVTRHSGFVSLIYFVLHLVIDGWSDTLILPAVLIIHVGRYYFDLGHRDVLNYYS